MAGETILVVDDAPVNLKLTDILLRKEGYKVHTATNAQEALDLLDTFRPDLILVDIQMPGMDGLELTRMLKADPLTRDILVVAFTACAMKEDEQKAFAAGCDGYITKPIDTHALGLRVRQYLELRRGAPDVPSHQPLPPGLTLAGPELEGLRRRFLEEGMLQTRDMLLCTEGSRDTLEGNRKVAERIHRWIGAAGFFGYSAICEAARSAETVLRAGPPNPLLLRELLTDLMFAFSEPREVAPKLPPVIAVEVLSGLPLALLGFSFEEGTRLASALERTGACPRLFNLADPAQVDDILACSALIFHVCPETEDSWWLGSDPSQPCALPLILVGTRDRIMALDRSVQMRAIEFLIDVWQPEEAVLRLSFALARATAVASPARGARAYAAHGRA